jgi:hypothetical protein
MVASPLPRGPWSIDLGPNLTPFTLKHAERCHKLIEMLKIMSDAATAAPRLAAA